MYDSGCLKAQFMHEVFCKSLLRLLLLLDGEQMNGFCLTYPNLTCPNLTKFLQLMYDSGCLKAQFMHEVFCKSLLRLLLLLLDGERMNGFCRQVSRCSTVLW